MRFRGVADGLQFTHGCFGGFIINRGVSQLIKTPDFAAEQLFHARPVVRLADVHGVRQGRLRRLRRPVAILQEARHGIVGVGSGNKTLNRQPQRFRQQAGGEIAEVAAWHRHHQLVTGLLRQLRDRLEVVADLRQQTTDINRVGGVEAKRDLQLFIVKRLLNQRLTGVEITVNRHGFDVAAQGAEQLLLQRANLTARIEDNYFDVRQAVEGMRHGRAGVAGGRGQDRHRLIACDMRQHLGHKTAAKIFKRQGRAVEQLQAADIILYLSDRRREGERRSYAGLQFILRDLIANKGRQDFRAAGHEILLEHFVDFGQVEFRQIVRKEQPLLFAKPLRHGLRKADLFVMIF